jgi:RNA polymerase sigma-54 factor
LFFLIGNHPRNPRIILSRKAKTDVTLGLMSMLSPQLGLGVALKTTLTPGLMQMVKILQMNRQELVQMVSAELAENPLLDESEGDQLTPEEVQAALEASEARVADPADAAFTAMMEQTAAPEADGEAVAVAADTAEAPEAVEGKSTDPFDEIDMDAYFDNYLDPGFKTPQGENIEKPSFETFLASPVTLYSHLMQQLSLIVLNPKLREAAELIIGNLDDNGYLNESLEAVAEMGQVTLEQVAEALTEVQKFDPAGIAARDVRECLLLQLESRRLKNSIAWEIVAEHMKLLETRQWKELAKSLDVPLSIVEEAVALIRHLDPAPGARFTSPDAVKVEPDVSIWRNGDEYVVQLMEEGMPDVRINRGYRELLHKDSGSEKEVRSYLRERYTSALMLMKNIEQRRQTILRVCHTIIDRQRDFLDHGIQHLRPMMIKDIAEEIGVHSSTVSRAVAGKYADTPQGIFELRYFFSEAAQGSGGTETPVLVLKQNVKKMIDAEDPRSPLTDDHIAQKLQAQGIQIVRRTVAKYREELRIPSSHERRRRD